MLKRYRLRDFDFKLVILIVILTVIGILAVGSAKQSDQEKQILGFVMGILDRKSVV